MKYTKPMNIRLEAETFKLLNKYAKANKTRVTTIVREMIANLVKPEKKRN